MVMCVMYDSSFEVFLNAGGIFVGIMTVLLVLRRDGSAVCTHIILNLVINPESHLLEIKLGSDDLDF